MTRKHPHRPWHTKGDLFIRGKQDRFPTQPRTRDEERFAAKPVAKRRKRVKGGRPAETYRGARRNAEFGRAAIGNRRVGGVE